MVNAVLESPSRSAKPSQSRPDEDSDEDEEVVDLKLIQSFADKIQHLPQLDQLGGPSRQKLVIPKRGEKDFEPLDETVNLQDMMLQKSREALFGTLVGVRGGQSKTISHALITPDSSYPSLLISRGHIFDSLGITVRDKGKSRVELLPEEALYLSERGSLQIWLGTATSGWSETIWGVEHAVELSVMESYAMFIGKDQLSWERYQAYAYLKRLGYTVQRTRQFLPASFHPTTETQLPPFRTWWRSIPGWMGHIVRLLRQLVLNISRPRSTSDFLRSFSGGTYALLFAALRVNTIDPKLSSNPSVVNPYEPFFHVWKPGRSWSKSKWDRGSETGLAVQPPDFAAAVVNSRHTDLPSQDDLAQVFDKAREEGGPQQRRGPQYTKSTPSQHNWMGSLRNGDRALVVAVNDSGNMGWVRFGRSSFSEHPLM